MSGRTAFGPGPGTARPDARCNEVYMKKPPKKTSPARKRKPGSAGKPEQPGAHSLQAKYILRLYVSESTLKSALAVENIKQVCAQHLNGRYDLEVIDISQHANLARDEQIVAVPTLIKRLPLPLRRLVGDLSNLKEVLLGLDLKMRD
jgi:circadian clock protein KaiB